MNDKGFIMRDAFVSKYIEGDKFPFSFCCGGKKANIRVVSRMKNRNDANTVTYFTVGKTGTLEVKMISTVYNSHAVVDWKVEITNKGEKNSPIITKGYGTDAEFEGKDVRLWHSTGDYYSAEGLDQTIDPIGKGISLVSNGRPCDGAFPYYRLLFNDFTIVGAVGWQAKWAGKFTEKDGKISVKAGQAILNSYMKPGETFKLSSTTLLFSDGDNTKAINDWRAYYFDCILPKPNGEKLKPTCIGSAFDSALEFCFSNEKSAAQCMDTFFENGYTPDIWWLDAGWYDYNIGDDAKDWVRVGTWLPDKNRFPNDLKPIGDRAHEHGMKFLLWFEPERVHIGTKLYKEHEDWLLKSPKDIYCALLNLGNHEALEYISNHINNMIKENGIDIYREDFNCDPDNYFRDSETEDRQGALENLHCQGYLKLWDNILAENPGLWIDSCASGGRRNDIESMKRGVPLHYSDFGYGDLPVKDAFQQTMYEWLPYFKEQPISWTESDETFTHLAALSPCISDSYDLVNSYPMHKRADKDGHPFELHPETRDMSNIERLFKYHDIWKTFNKYSYGNYYQFTNQSKGWDKWSVLQFTCSKCGGGILKALRFKDNPDDHFTFSPAEIDLAASYEVTNLVTEEVAVMPGYMLGKNFTITLEPGKAVIFEYRKL